MAWGALTAAFLGTFLLLLRGPPKPTERQVLAATLQALVERADKADEHQQEIARRVHALGREVCCLRDELMLDERPRLSAERAQQMRLKAAAQANPNLPSLTGVLRNTAQR